jgi:hypothetical protein
MVRSREPGAGRIAAKRRKRRERKREETGDPPSRCCGVTGRRQGTVFA